jgi:DNA-binding winged helix-turn-helix (wHTH) protein
VQQGQRQSTAAVAYRFGAFRLDLAREELVGPAGTCVLRRKAFDTLRLLLEAAPAVVTLDALLDRVWGRHAISASAVPGVIVELRRALGDDAGAARYIETRHRRGYRMREPVLCERHAVGVDLLGTIEESCLRNGALPARQRLEQLQRMASERGLTFLALQAQLALQGYAHVEGASRDEQACVAPLTAAVFRR